MKKIAMLALLIIFCAIFAGCATLSIYAKVNPDTTISNYKVTIETTSMVYGMIVGQIKSGFDESLYNYDEKWTGDKVTITLTAKTNIQSIDPVNWTIKKEDNRMIYEDKRFSSSFKPDKNNEYSTAMMNSISLHYYLEMPGTITKSNANKVDGNKAEWHLVGEKLSTPIQAESELPALPGFETILAIFGIVGALFLIKKSG